MRLIYLGQGSFRRLEGESGNRGPKTIGRSKNSLGRIDQEFFSETSAPIFPIGSEVGMIS